MTKSILIIDDETIIVKALTRAFQKEGFSILSAQDGQEGLEKIFTHKPSLILLDVLMPKLNGLEVLETIRKRKIKTPVILMTAYGDSETEFASKNLGISAYLTKPFDHIENIIRLVKSTLL